MRYDDFIGAKAKSATFCGVEHGDLNAAMFPHQRDLVRWALRKGRAAIFADTGLGKSLMELEWARAVSAHGRVLILTPLAVAQQMVREGIRFGVSCQYLRADDGHTPIVVTNYEMLPHFDPAAFVGIVLDESSILKAFDGKTRTTIIEAFADTPFRLAGTATPAPNDHTELGNHSEFLGIKTRTEMLAEYFVHDGDTTQEWRIKGHARDQFWRWVSSWGAVIQKPSDLGYEDGGYNLPECVWHEHVIPVGIEDAWRAGVLFADEARSLTEQRANRKATMRARVELAASMTAGTEPWVIWCELNAEADAVTASIEGAVQVAGSDSHDVKSERLAAFADGRIRVLVTKPSVAGFGLNWQHCANTVFLGASNSFEQTYQAVRRFWRFGQTRRVNVHVIRAENEGAIVANYRRKESDAARMGAEMKVWLADAVRSEVQGASAREWNDYSPRAPMKVPDWIRAVSMEAM
jgi:superfamily II DNA or RNA helicase